MVPRPGEVVWWAQTISEKDWVSGAALEARQPHEHKPDSLAGRAQVDRLMDSPSGFV